MSLSLKYIEIIKLNNKMGVSNPLPAQSYINTETLQFIKKSSFGKHYKDKISQQQFVLVQSNILPVIDQKSSHFMITSTLMRRSKLKSKNTPQVLQYSQNSTHLCNSVYGFTLWMLHPAKSLTEQISQRESLCEVFQQGEIWMIIYGALNALAHLQYFGVQLLLNNDILFISEHGQIVLSDAYLYSNPNFYTNNMREISLQQNIEQLIRIITNLTSLDTRHGVYSRQLQILISKLKSIKFTNYKNVCRLVMDIKRQFDCKNTNQNKRQVQFDGIVEEVMSEFVDFSSNQDTPIRQLDMLSKQHLQQNRLPQKSIRYDSKIKHKFYRTSPVRRFQLQRTYNINMNSMPDVEQQNWTQVSDISSISDKMMTADFDNISNPVNRLFGQDITNKSMSAEILWEQNKRELQGLILQQRNIIFEVSESEVDLSSVQSMRNSYHNTNVTLLSTANQSS